MKQGKFIAELYRRICAQSDDGGLSLPEFVQLADTLAHEHPVWYERFWWSTKFVRGWRWAISGTWFGRSKKRDDSSSGSGDGTSGYGDG